MKMNIFLAFGIAIALVSCNSNDDLAGVTSVSEETSVSVASYVANNYPDTKIISTTASSSNVVTVLNTGEELTMTQSGKLISYANNFKAGLEADSLGIPCDSTRGHKPGEGPGPGKHGGKGGKGGDHGNKPDSTQMGGKPGGHGHDRHFKNEISVDSLPAEINTYIAANYSGYNVIHAQTDTICEGAVTQVMVCTTGSEPVKLIFDASGVYMMKASRIDYANVLTAVSDAVTANYATYKVMKRAEQFTLADSSIQYKVFMSLDKVRKSVTFRADGSVACEK